LTLVSVGIAVTVIVVACAFTLSFVYATRVIEVASEVVVVTALSILSI
jgi:hypothetical protein